MRVGAAAAAPLLGARRNSAVQQAKLDGAGPGSPALRDAPDAGPGSGPAWARDRRHPPPLPGLHRGPPAGKGQQLQGVWVKLSAAAAALLMVVCFWHAGAAGRGGGGAGAGGGAERARLIGIGSDGLGNQLNYFISMGILSATLGLECGFHFDMETYSGTEGPETFIRLPRVCHDEVRDMFNVSSGEPQPPREAVRFTSSLRDRFEYRWKPLVKRGLFFQGKDVVMHKHYNFCGVAGLVKLAEMDPREFWERYVALAGQLEPVPGIAERLAELQLGDGGVCAHVRGRKAEVTAGRLEDNPVLDHLHALVTAFPGRFKKAYVASMFDVGDRLTAEVSAIRVKTNTTISVAGTEYSKLRRSMLPSVVDMFALSQCSVVLLSEDLVRGTFGTLAAGIGNFKQCPDLAASIGIDPDLVMCKEGPGPSVFINEQRCIRTCRYWSPGVCI